MFYVNEPSTIEDIIKKSRFISLSFLCANDQVVLYQLKKLQDEHPHANCNGQVKQDTLLSRLFIKFPLILNRGLIA